jgi:PAS domain S-box-containing protein
MTNPPTRSSFVTDVSEYKRAEESLHQRKEALQALLNAPLETILLIDRNGILLKESEAQFRAVFEKSPIAMALLDPQGHPVTSNPALERLLGYTADELRRMVFTDFTHPDDVDESMRLYQELVEGRRDSCKSEVRYFHKEGHIVWGELYATVARGKGGRPKYLIGMIRDITEQRHAEDQLKESEERFRNMVEQSPLGIEILTPEGQINQVNPAWLKLWGIAEEDVAQVLAEYNMLSDEQIVELGIAQLVENAFAGQQVVLPPIRYVGERTMEDLGVANSKAKAPWIQCHLFPVKNAKGEITNVVNTYMDITEQKQAEESLKAYRERLRALALELTLSEERERRRIATELHDGAAQSLAFARLQLASACKEVGEAGAAKKLDDVSQILRESLGQIREVLLDLSSPSMNEIGLGVAISEWLEQQIGRRHGLKTSFADQCGKVPLDDDVRAVLFRNTRELLTNVVKHAQAHTVVVRMESTGEALRITIEDDGVGLDPDNAAGTSGGGFGIFSIRERMFDLGGSLEIVSARGKGCEATLVMPLDRDEERN